MSAIFKREFKAYFYSPIGYGFLTAYLVFSGICFYAFNINQGTASLTSYFSIVSSWPLMIFISILTMKLLTEERKNKTDQLLLTSPISLSGIVCGKFFAALAVYAIGAASVLIYTIFLAFMGKPDFLLIVGNLFGLLLLGAMFISIGLFASSLTENQLIAAIITFIMLFFFMVLDIISAAFQIQAVSDAITFISVYNRFNEFTNGIFNFANVIYFLSIISLFLFLTVRVLEKRRWN